MKTNTDITIYHKIIDNHNEKWNNQYFDKVWAYIKVGSSNSNGLSNNNTIEVRIPYQKTNFTIGDLIIIGKGKTIQKSTDIKGFKITSINVNNFGTQPHIHITGV